MSQNCSLIIFPLYFHYISMECMLPSVGHLHVTKRHSSQFSLRARTYSHISSPYHYIRPIIIGYYPKYEVSTVSYLLVQIKS